MFRPDRGELLLAILAGAGFAGVYWLHHGALLAFYGSLLAIPGAFLGMGTMFVLATRWYWAEPAQRWMRFERARDAALVPLLCVGSMIAVGPAIGLTPLTYDRVLYLFDAKLAGSRSTCAELGDRSAVCRCTLDSSGLFLRVQQLAARLGDLFSAAMAGSSQEDLVSAGSEVALNDAGLHWICAVPILSGGRAGLSIPERISGSDSESGGDHRRAGVHARRFRATAWPSLHVGWTMLLLWNMRHRAWWISTPAAFLYVDHDCDGDAGVGRTLSDGSGGSGTGRTGVAGDVAARGRIRRHGVVMVVAFVVVFTWLFAFRSGVALSIPAGAAAWTVAGATVVVSIVVAWWMERTMRPRRSRVGWGGDSMQMM